MIRKIPTRRSRLARMLDHWLVAALVYAPIAVWWVAINWRNF